MADALALGASAARHVGSNPTLPTKIKNPDIRRDFLFSSPAVKSLMDFFKFFIGEMGVNLRC